VVNEHVVYPGAPVVLVALEIRHPTADPLTPTESRAIKKLIGDDLPIERGGQISTVESVLGGPTSAPTVEHFPRYFNRESTVAVSLKREALVVEVSNYPGWQKFHSLVMKAVHARMQIAPVVGIERVGLRYIDELRIPGQDPPDWAQWVHPTLLAPSAAGATDLPLQQWQSVAVYGGSQPGRTIVFRYGPKDGFAVDPSSDLVRAKPANGGPYFLMDIDSFWARGGTVPEFDTAFMKAVLDELHRPVRLLFDQMVTTNYRSEVLER
jgi:uncharacterized protein (TIGR04255 family)